MQSARVNINSMHIFIRWGVSSSSSAFACCASCQSLKPSGDVNRDVQCGSTVSVVCCPLRSSVVPQFLWSEDLCFPSFCGLLTSEVLGVSPVSVVCWPLRSSVVPQFLWSAAFWGPQWFPTVSVVCCPLRSSVFPQFLWSADLWGPQCFPSFCGLLTSEVLGVSPVSVVCWPLRSSVFPQFLWSAALWGPQWFPSFCGLLPSEVLNGSPQFLWSADLWGPHWFLTAFAVCCPLRSSEVLHSFCGLLTSEVLSGSPQFMWSAVLWGPHWFPTASSAVCCPLRSSLVPHSFFSSVPPSDPILTQSQAWSWTGSANQMHISHKNLCMHILCMLLWGGWGLLPQLN